MRKGEGETLDAVGSWEGGKLCSMPMSVCVWYPNMDIPNRGIPNREHEHGQKYCTVHTVIRSAAQE
jgi:hypothetical protein